MEYLETESPPSYEGISQEIPIAVLDIQNVIRDLKDRGIGVLITDHNVRETLGIVDCAYILNQGKLLVKGQPEEILENDEARKVYLGEKFRM